jgi:hypothetical protein
MDRDRTGPDRMAAASPTSPSVLSGSTAMRGAAPEVIGRGAELATVARVLEAVREKGAGALLLEGGLGIGKTTVWKAGLDLARTTGYLVLACAPAGEVARLSFVAIGDLLAPVLDELLPALPAPQRRALEIALLLRDLDGPPPDDRAVAVAFHTALSSSADVHLRELRPSGSTQRCDARGGGPMRARCSARHARSSSASARACGSIAPTASSAASAAGRRHATSSPVRSGASRARAPLRRPVPVGPGAHRYTACTNTRCSVAVEVTLPIFAPVLATMGTVTRRSRFMRWR